MPDLTQFFEVAAAGVPRLLLVIMGLVEYFKRFKRKDGTQLFTGNVLLLISMAIGLLFGLAWVIFQVRPPGSSPDWWPVYVYWFGAGLYGLVLGLVASGLYDVLKDVVLPILTRLKELKP